MGVEIEAYYEGELHCTALHGPSGHRLGTDAPVDNGGKGETFSPTDLVATALGSCILTVMGIVAQRNQLDIEGTRVHVVKEMAAAPVRRISALNVTVHFPQGKPLSTTDRQKLEQIASICPVKQSLHPETKITMSFIYP